MNLTRVATWLFIIAMVLAFLVLAQDFLIPLRLLHRTDHNPQTVVDIAH
jgi:hypothetical protein